MVKRIINNDKKVKQPLFGATFIGIGCTIASILTSVVLGKMTEAAGMQKTEISLMGKMILQLALFFLLEVFLIFFYQQMRRRSMAEVNQSISLQFAESINNARITWIQKKDMGDLTSRFQADVTEASHLFVETFQEIILQSIRIFLFGSIMIIINWQLALIYYGSVLLIIYLQMKISTPMQKYMKNKRVSYGEMNAFAQDVLNNHKTIKMFNAQPMIARLYHQRLEVFFKSSLRCELFISPIRMISWVCGLVPILLLCILGAIFLSDGILTLSTFMMLYFMAELSLNDMMHYGDLFSDYRKAKASIERVYEIIDTPNEERLWKTLEMGKTKPSGSFLSIDEVSFTYKKTENIDECGESEKNVSDVEKRRGHLYNISLNVYPGEKIAIVGRSGCGKSTLLKLLLGFIEPDKGTICLENKVYSQMTLEEIRKKISYVSQDSFLFPWTVKENICSGNEERIGKFAEICDKAQINSFVENLPEQYDTSVGERGAGFSGGQIQRLALARGFMKPASLLLLDEATSALDVRVEQSIQKAINELSCAVITVAHRLSAVQDSDRIYVMESGRIIECGNHEELLRRKGTYAELFGEQEE